MGYIKYLGHAAFEIVVDGKKVLVDPWLENPRSPVKPGEVEGVDYIVVTHDHFDHVGNAVEIARRNRGARIVGVYETASRLAREVGDEERGVGGNIGGPIRLGDLEIALTPAVHSSQTGAPVGVVIIGREARIYHAGDTGVTMDMRLVGELYRPDVALLPVGGHFTMDPREAAKAVELIRPRVAIPMHYGTFPVLYGDPKEFEKLVEERCLPTRVVIISPGESFDLGELGAE